MSRAPGSEHAPRFCSVPAAAAMALCVSSAALAHPVGLSRGRYAASGGVVSAELTVSRPELAAAAGDPSAAAGAEWLAQRVRVSSGGAPCRLDGAPAVAGEEDPLLVALRYRCEGSGPKAVALDFLAELPPGHRHLAGERVLSAGDPWLTVDDEVSGAGLRFVTLGLEHILGGFDHLLFLLGLVLGTRRPREVLGVVTAFTVAHSLTLAGGALAGWSPSPRLIEPLIALSIAYVGVENLVRPHPARRWRVAFAFGLLHGCAFGGALREVGVAPGQWALALLGFNAGVELGQLAVLALVLPALAVARRRESLWGWVRPGLSASVVAPGLVWFVLRLAG